MYLDEEPRARERKLKDRAIVNVLLKHYKDLKGIEKEILIDVCRAYANYDRAWRQILSETPRLRGTDYDVNGSKNMLEQEKMLDLGYEVGIDQDVKKLKTL